MPVDSKTPGFGRQGQTQKQEPVSFLALVIKTDTEGKRNKNRQSEQSLTGRQGRAVHRVKSCFLPASVCPVPIKKKEGKSLGLSIALCIGNIHLKTPWWQVTTNMRSCYKPTAMRLFPPFFLLLPIMICIVKNNYE